MSAETFECIAVDMGAGSIRVMLGQLGKVSISYQEIYRFENRMVHLDGHERWDMEAIKEGLSRGIGEALEKSANLSSIGVDSWGVDYALLDGSGSLVDMPVAYRDSRTEHLRSKWSSMMPEEETYARTGINFYIFNTLFQLLSQKNSPLMQQVERILFMPAYINFLLSGVRANELTIASTSQMLEVGSQHWDSRILELLGIPASLLEPVIMPGTSLGPMRWPQEKAGITCIAVCGHDTACVVASLPVENDRFAYISAGTWCVVGIESSRPVSAEKALVEGFTNERGYGNSYRLLKNVVGLWLIQELRKRMPGSPPFAELEKTAAEFRHISQVIDPDDPLFYNPENMREAFDLYFRKSGQEIPKEWGAYLRCAYDSLCFSFRYHLEQLEQLGEKDIQVLHMVGGGSQSDYLNQRTADICERPVISGPVEGATLGNILVQAVAMGRLENLQEGRAMVKRSFPGKRYRPRGFDDRASKRYESFLKHRSNTKA